jgi:hypothetical protein
MGLMENVYVQIIIVILVFYIVTQVIQKPSVSEHLDEPVDVGNGKYAGGDGVMYEPVPVVLPTADGQITASANPSVQSATGGSQVTTGGAQSAPQGLSALGEPILAQAPQQSAEDAAALTVSPVDYDQFFSSRGALDPADLIPKSVPSDIYGDMKPNPALDQNFIQNSFQLGIQTQAPKRNYVHDLRGAPPNPITVISPFLNATIMPDFQRKTLEISEHA